MKKIWSKAAFIMYTAEGGGRGRGYFWKGQSFHIPSHNAELFDIPPLDQKKREERSSILDVRQKIFKDLLTDLCEFACDHFWL